MTHDEIIRSVSRDPRIDRWYWLAAHFNSWNLPQLRAEYRARRGQPAGNFAEQVQIFCLEILIGLR